MTLSGNWRHQIIRMYWDGEEKPSVEVPAADFFASGWCMYSQINSLPVNVNAANAFNCYWVMPFRKKCKITFENRQRDNACLYYQIDYTLTDVPKDEAYFHSQFRRVNPLKEKDVITIVDGIKGRGQYVGTYMAWKANSPGWWGEGEIKFYMDGDKEFPTICGTGTEDYFLGSYCFGDTKDYTTPYVGYHAYPVKEGEKPRFNLYRWHIMDPIRFEKDLKVTMQALGWQSEGRYLPLQDDVASTAFWYQTEPHTPFPSLPDNGALEPK